MVVGLFGRQRGIIDILLEKVAETLNNSFNSIITIIKTAQDKGGLRSYVETNDWGLVVEDLRLFVPQWQMSDWAFNWVKQGGELSNSTKVK